MSDVAEASWLLREIAEPRPIGDSVKAAINRAARRVSAFLPMTAGRVEDIWRNEARMIRACEMDAIRAAARKRKEANAQRETAGALAALSTLRELYVSKDAELFGEQILAIEQILRDPRHGFRAVGNDGRSEEARSGLTAPPASNDGGVA